jgi:hypothetical protein
MSRNRISGPQIETAPALFGFQRVYLIGCGTHTPPRQFDAVRNHLHGPTQIAVDKAGPQVRVSDQHHSGALAQQ